MAIRPMATATVIPPIATATDIPRMATATPRPTATAIRLTPVVTNRPYYGAYAYAGSRAARRVVIHRARWR